MEIFPLTTAASGKYVRGTNNPHSAKKFANESKRKKGFLHMAKAVDSFLGFNFPLFLLLDSFSDFFFPSLVKQYLNLP